jgi:hypothetical protein
VFQNDGGHSHCEVCLRASNKTFIAPKCNKSGAHRFDSTGHMWLRTAKDHDRCWHLYCLASTALMSLIGLSRLAWLNNLKSLRATLDSGERELQMETCTLAQAER